ncbi:MAG: LptF/LptG family permease [Candidatus Poribacteria bacterium]|nr:LptF/LptG family permease [Candidatus Poribacteria bacterium]
MRLITRYVLTEFLLYFFLALVASTSILVLRHIFLLTKLFVRKDVNLMYMVELILYALPNILSLTIPIAVLAGFLMVLGQFAFTGEVTAIQASGVGMHQLLPPILTVGVAFFVFDFWMMNVAMPWGNTEYVNLRNDIQRQNPAVILEPDTVMRDLEQHEILWFFDRIEPTTENLLSVRLWERYRSGKPRFVMAEYGVLGMTDGRGALTLYNGVSYERDPQRDEGVTKTAFQTETLYVPLNEDITRNEYTMGRSYRAMNQSELAEEIRARKSRLLTETSELSQNLYRQNIARATYEWHKKLAIPFACIAFALVSLPLGVMIRRSGFMVGMIVGLPLIIVFYTIERVADTLSVRGHLSAALGPWLPSVPIVLLGGVLLYRMLKR